MLGIKIRYPVVDSDVDFERIFKSGIRNDILGIGYWGKYSDRKIVFLGEQMRL